MKADLEDYVRYLGQEEKSRATIQKYTRDARQFIRFVEEKGGADPGMEITKELVLSYKLYLTEQYQPASVNSMLAAVNHYLAYSGRQDCRVKLLKIQKKVFCDQKHELERSDYILLVQAAHDCHKERLALIMETICCTGIRIGELSRITVEASENGWAKVHGKGKERVILIPRKLCGKLKAYCEEHSIKSGSIFITRSGAPVNRSNVWREMHNLCQHAGIPAEKVFPHNMRHLFARTYYRNQKDIVRLADILGHSSIETTRIYTMTSCGEYEKELDEMELII